MMILDVNDKEYKVKFGYKALAKSEVLKEVIRLENINTSEDSTSKSVEVLGDIFDILAKLTLSGLQKFNKDFEVDYDSPQSVKDGIEKVYDLLDDYMDNEDNDVFELFNEMVTELTSRGFLAQKSEKLENSLTEQNATVVPQDHLRTEN